MKNKRIDITGLWQRAQQALFLLDDRGRLAFANPAFLALLEATGIHQPPAPLVTPPVDLAPGQVRRATRPWGDGKQRRWFDVIFIPLDESIGIPLATLGCVVAGTRGTEITPAADSELAERLERIAAEQRAQFGFDALPARGDAMKRLLQQVHLAAGARVPVTLVGPAGAGKQTLARVVHHQGPAPRGAFVVLDCRALPPDLQRRQLLGGFDAAPGGGAGILGSPGPGTLLLLGPLSMPRDLQNELVRFLAADAGRWRLLACEREPLARGRDDGRLLTPLYHLLSTFVVEVPPLRERTLELADHCAWVLARLAERGSKTLVIEPAAHELLAAYSWPGNLRELYLVLEQASQRSGGRTLAPADLPRRFRKPAAATTEPTRKPPPLPGLDGVLEEVERRLLQLALERARGNKSQAADELAISRQRLLRRLEQLGI